MKVLLSFKENYYKCCLLNYYLATGFEKKNHFLTFIQECEGQLALVRYWGFTSSQSQIFIKRQWHIYLHIKNLFLLIKTIYVTSISFTVMSFYKQVLWWGMLSESITSLKCTFPQDWKVKMSTLKAQNLRLHPFHLKRRQGIEILWITYLMSKNQ